MLSFGVAGGNLGYGGDRFGLILFGRCFEVSVVDQGLRRSNGGVCEYLELAGSMLVAVVDFGWWKFDGLLAQSLSSAVSID